MAVMGVKKYITAKNMIIAITFCLILASGILTRENPLYMLPLFVSLLVMALQAEVNRTAYLIGSLNSVVYAVVYLDKGLYATAGSALLFSFPFQLVTFLNWKRKAYGKATIFKKLDLRARVILGAGFVVSFALLQFVLAMMGSDYAILDNASSLIGVLVSVLSLLAYIEYIYLQVFGSLLTIALNVQVTLSDLSHVTYLIYSLYCVYCLAMAFRNVRRIYQQQQEECRITAESTENTP